MNLKRDLIKYCRDKAKSGYLKNSECGICGAIENLEFHHYNSMTMMLDNWLFKNKLTIETAEQIMACRDRFIEEHHAQVYTDTVTLCKEHHAKLHKIYSIKPPLATAAKQARWVQRQKDKHEMALE